MWPFKKKGVSQQLGLRELEASIPPPELEKKTRLEPKELEASTSQSEQEIKPEKKANSKSEAKEVLFYVSKPAIPILPDIESYETFDIKYELIPPYAFAHVFWDKQNKEIVYSIEEPELTEDEKRILNLLEEGIKELINISFISVKEGSTVIQYLEKNINVLLSELNINITQETYLKIMYYAYRDFVGLNEIEPLLSDYFIEDIECNGLNTPIYIVHRKYRNMRTNITYSDFDKLSNFIEKLAQKCGKYISYATPLLDGSLPDGSRVNATFASDISSRGPTFTIRKFTKEPWTPIHLMQLKTVSPEILAFLWLLIEYESNIMVIGGTASGKTTLLNALAFFIPPKARVVSIEDTRELALMHENWLPSVTRAGFMPGAEAERGYGEITLFDLLKESFRQRPDYVIVGEVRGKEAFVLFQGMSAGHPSFGTMHATSVDSMIKRLETPPIDLSPSLINALDVICVIAQTKIRGKISRRLKEVVEIIDVKEGGRALVNIPFRWDPASDRFFFKTKSYLFDKLYTKHGISKEYLLKEFKLRTMLLMKLYQQNMSGFRDVQNIINVY